MSELSFSRSVHIEQKTITQKRSKMIDCGRLIREVEGGKVFFDSLTVPSVQGMAANSLSGKLFMPIVDPQGSGGNTGSGGFYSDTTTIPAFTGYAPGILLTSGNFSYSSWDDNESWASMVRDRSLSASEERKVQVCLTKSEDPGSLVINFFYTSAVYVQMPEHWQQIYSTQGKDASRLVVSPGGTRLRAEEDFILNLPASGDYVIIAHFDAPGAKALTSLPSVIDADEYNKKPDWSFLPMSC